MLIHHLLLICPTYVTQRATLVAGVNEILLKNNLNHLENQCQLYLYGHHSISYADNSNIYFEIYKGHSSFLNLRVSSLIGSVGCGWMGACVDMLPLFFTLFLPFLCYLFVCSVLNYFHSILVLCCNFLRLSWLCLSILPSFDRLIFLEKNL